MVIARKTFILANLFEEKTSFFSFLQKKNLSFLNIMRSVASASSHIFYKKATNSSKISLQEPKPQPRYGLRYKKILQASQGLKSGVHVCGRPSKNAMGRLRLPQMGLRFLAKEGYGQLGDWSQRLPP